MILFLKGTVVACMIQALKVNKDQTKDVKDSISNSFELINRHAP